MSINDLTGSAPYNNSYDPDLNFLQLLFVPGRPLQSAELNQVARICQNQIAAIGSHLFKNGSTIIGAKINLNPSKPCAVVFNQVVSNRIDGTLSATPITGTYAVENFIGRTYENVDPTIVSPGTPTKRIKITHAQISDDSSEINLYYTFAGVPPVANELFFDAEGSSGIAIKIKNDQIETTAISCEPGLLYRNGFFITVVAQEVIHGKALASDLTNVVAGYFFKEDVVTESDPYIGELLNDPANGFRNYAAPGAHRYRVTPILDSYDKASESLLPDTFRENFVPLVEMKDRVIIFDQRDTQYNKILDLLARRTYDESGNYTVRPFSLSLTPSITDPDRMTAKLGAGKAYVLGYEVDKLNSTSFDIDRARESIVVNNTYSLAGDHFYFVVQNSNASGIASGSPQVKGKMDLRSGAIMYAYDRGISGVDLVPRNSCTKLGEARFHSFVKVGNEYRVYVTDVTPELARNASSIASFRNPLSVSSVNEPYILTTVAYRTANSVAVNGTRTEKIGITSDRAELVGSGLEGKPAQGSTTKPPIKVDPIEDTLGTPASIGGEFKVPLVYPITRATVIKSLVPNESSFSYYLQRPGILTGGSSVTFVGQSSSVNFFSEAEGGIALLMVDNVGANIESDFVQVYPSEISATVDNSSFPATITLNISGARAAGFAGRNVIAVLKHEQAEAAPRQKQVTTFTETVSVIPTNKALLTKEDLYRIVSVRQITNTLSSEPNPRVFSADELKLLTLDNGQREHWYDVGIVSGFNRIASLQVPNVATSYEISYEYFDHVTPGTSSYFCVNSYPFSGPDLDKIPDYTSSNGERFDLVNCVDFRSKLSEILDKPLISPMTRFRTDIDTYLGRIDKISLDNNGNFHTIKGISSFSPDAPQDISNAMSLYTITYAPYTYDRTDIRVKAIDTPRYTMRDIKRLEDRIERTEDIVTLSLLEQSALNLNIIDSATGFDKFKSGLFADSCRDHTKVDYQDLDHRVAMDTVLGGARCPFESSTTELVPILNGTNVQTWANTFTLVPLGVEVMCENLYASSFINVNPYLFYTWNGTVNLIPSVDTWKDTRYAPEIRNDSGSWELPPNNSGETQWGDWEYNWTGTSYTRLSNPVLDANGNIISATSTTSYSNTATGQTRSGTQSSWIPTVSTEVDDRVIDTGAIPYARPITVKALAQGMRQGMPVKVYLDGIEMTSAVPNGAQYTYLSGRIKADDQGTVDCSFQIPENRISAGSVNFSIIDDANTSSATTVFTSAGILETRQQTVTTVRGIQEIRTVTSETRPISGGPTNTTSTSTTTYFDPIAQSFVIDSRGGTFLANIEVFFKKKPTVVTDVEYLPVQLYLVEMSNGTPTQKILPMSIVTLQPNQVNASETPSLGGTVFTFSDPIFLEDATEYAFILFSNSRDYEVWISTLGEQDRFNASTSPAPVRDLGIQDQAARAAFASSVFTTLDGQTTISDINSHSVFPEFYGANGGTRGSNLPGTGIAEQPYLGSLFKSQNSSTWTPEQGSDITFKIRKYRFPINTDQNLVLGDSKQDISGKAVYSLSSPSKLVALAQPNIGELILPQTSLSYQQSFYQGSVPTYQPVVNRETVQLDTEYVLDVNSNASLRNNYSIRASFRSQNNNLTPVIDRQQTRVNTIRYTVFDYDISYDQSNPLSVLPASTYDAGTYIHKIVNLVNPADDLRVVLDAKLPANGFMKVFYRTSEAAPSYFESKVNFIPSTGLAGQICRLLYRNASTFVVGDPNTITPTFTESDIRCLVTRVDNDVSPRRVYLRSMTEVSRFKPDNDISLAAVDRVFIVPELAAEDIASQPIQKIPDWDVGTDFSDPTEAKFVFHVGRLWKVSPAYPYAVSGLEPSIGGSAWILVSSAVLGTNIIAGQEQAWKPMRLKDQVLPNFSPSTRFLEYQYVPNDVAEEFGRYSVKVEMYALNKANVPVIKNVRSIAVL